MNEVQIRYEEESLCCESGQTLEEVAQRGFGYPSLEEFNAMWNVALTTLVQ